MRKSNLQLGNFICTFGSKGELLDFLDELVIPTFFDDSQVRQRGSSSFYIYEPFWINFGDDSNADLAIAGRFVKDTTLTREQVLDQGKLIEAYGELQSSPSAFFVLLLRDHRLLYFAETAHAPPLQTFASSVQIIMRRKWRKLLNDRYSASSNELTHKEIRAEIPMPVVNVVSVAKTAQIKALLKHFEKITRLKFRLIRPNQETDASEVFQSVRDRLQPLEPARLDIELAQSEGLDAAETEEAVSEAATGMNTDISISGVDAEGNKLRVQNDDLALSIPIENPPSTKKSLAKRLYKAFQEHVQDGSVRRGTPSNSIKVKLKALAQRVL